MVPTHLICLICNDEAYMKVNERMPYTCSKCGQRYELAPSRYGVAMLIVGKTDEGGEEIEGN